MNDATGDKGAILSERHVPWPRTVSQKARDMLASLAEVNMRGAGAGPDPRDAAAWRRYVEQTNEMLLLYSGFYSVESRPGIRSETTWIGGARVHISTPENLSVEAQDRVYLEIHGGGLVFLEGEGCRRGGLREAERVGVRTISIDYRVPPDHPYPAALDDCLAVYRALLNQHQPGHIIIGGISGGGNLAAALALRARDEGLPLPAALVLLTPEVDLTESGDSFETCLGLDPVITSKLTDQITAYAGGHDLADPYVSPLFGDFSLGYPPTFLQSGTRDMFLSNTVRMHRALRKAGIPAELHVWEGMPHGGFLGAPEDDEVSAEMRRFIDAHWKR